MNKLLIILFVFVAEQSFSQKHNSFSLSKAFIDKQLYLSAEQIEYLATLTPSDKFPQTLIEGKLKHSSSSWWCSGFYPGTLLLLSEATNTEKLLNLAKDKLKYLEKEQFNKGTHDLGFMLFCSFGNALRLTGDSVKYQPVLLTGAESLSSRFSQITNTIRSWNHGSWNYPVIIDNMMNLEFLMQASKISGNAKYRNIAILHANTTLKNHFRKDFSSYHVIDYDPNTGNVISKQTHQGAYDESAWSRGQGWGLYGFTMMYRETGDSAYLARAKEVANYILTHKNLPADLIPYWDFDKDDVPTGSKMYKNKDLRDASAAALIASALLELSQYTVGKVSAKYLAKAELMIKSLSSDHYFAKNGENGGFILKHSVGALPLDSEIDVPLSYADYYYVEALLRYKRLLNGQRIVQQ